MKTLKRFISACAILGMVMNFSIVAFAAEDLTTHSDISANETEYFTLDEAEDPMLVGAEIISEETHIDGDRMITVTKYKARNGMIIVDSFERSAIAALSESGSDTATRTRDLGRYGTVSLTASFKWYTDKNAAGGIGIGYVKCTSASGSRTTPSGYTCDIWDLDYDDEYLPLGKAEAKLTYKIYETKAPMYEIYQYLKITCTDTGTISDKSGNA